MKPTKRVTPAALLVLLVMVAPGCGDAGGARTFTVTVTCNPGQLLGDGSDFAVCSVQVLDQDHVPADSGTRVVFIGRDAGDPGRETGVFGAERNSQVSKFLDQAGSATTEFRCTEVGTVAVIAQTDAGDRSVAQVACLEISGDWVIDRVVPDQGGIRPGESVSVCAWALTGDGENPPAGTVLRFTSNAVNGGFGSNASESRSDGTDGQGKACVTYVADAGNYVETVTLTANFENINFGNTPASVDLLVDSDLPENALRMSAVDETLLADGVSRTTLTVTVFGQGAAALEGEPVTCSIESGGGTLSDGGMGTTSAAGTLVLTYTAGTTPGTVTIRCRAPGVSPDAEATVNIDLVTVGEIVSLGPDTSPLGIQGTGIDENAEICFLLRDNRDQAFPAGLEVDFDTTGSSSDGASVDPATTTTGEDGVVCTTLSSGNTFGVAVVNACVTVGGEETCGRSEDIPVVGAIPSRGGGMSLTCDVRNIGALRYQQGDQITEPDTGSLCTTCELRLRDRDGNLVGFERQVTFGAESGRFSPSAQTTNDLDGRASVEWCADGNLPTDVTPIVGEPSWVYANGVTHNPRDGVVTIIAFVNGEEEFTDSNQNGTWDPGEPFFDQSEPFIDADDNNRFNVPQVDNERHIDISGGGRVSGQFDAANQVWDGDTVIWVETRVVLTGSPYFDVAGEITATLDEPDAVLDFDADYPTTPRLSHWHVEVGENEVNRYAPEESNPTCETDADPFCYIVPESWTAPLRVSFVARDINGNPINGSISSITHELFPVSDCSGAMSVTADTFVSPGNELPFDFEVIKERGAEPRDYWVRISNFVTGSVQPFLVSSGGGSFFQTGCQFRMVVPLTACADCGDPADPAPWPAFLLNEPQL